MRLTAFSHREGLHFAAGSRVLARPVKRQLRDKQGKVSWCCTCHSSRAFTSPISDRAPEVDAPWSGCLRGMFFPQLTEPRIGTKSKGIDALADVCKVARCRLGKPCENASLIVCAR